MHSRLHRPNNLLTLHQIIGKSGSIYNLVKSCLDRAKERAFHENPNRIQTELTFINP